MRDSSTNWKLVSVVVVVIGAAIGVFCGFRGILFKHGHSTTKTRLELNGAPVQQPSDWSID